MMKQSMHHSAHDDKTHHISEPFYYHLFAIILTINFILASQAFDITVLFNVLIWFQFC